MIAPRPCLPWGFLAGLTAFLAALYLYLRALASAPPKPGRASRLNPSVFDTEMEWDMDLTVSIHEGTKKSIQLNPTDANGQPATLVGAPTYSVSDPSVLTAEPSADGLRADLTLLAPGSCDVAIHGEGDETAGADPLDAVVHVTVLGFEASALNPSIVDTPA